MNLWRKAWRESRIRFVAAAVAISVYCVWFMVWARGAFPLSWDPSIPYSGVVWAEIYGNRAPAIFSLMALVLGLGGLRRENAYVTSSFTLALPVSRHQLVSARAMAGLVELVALALIPAVLLPVLSPGLAHQQYGFTSPLQFAVLYVSWGAIWFAVGFFWSTVLEGEYAAAVAAVLTPFVYMIVYATVSNGGRKFMSANAFLFMSGGEYLRPHSGLFAERLPWTTLPVLIAIALAILASAAAITGRQSF